MKNNMNWNFDNSYSRLPSAFKEHTDPVAVKKPELILINEDLAKELNLDFTKINNDELLQSHKYLGRYNLNDIIFRQKNATENIFLKKNIPFRSFEIKKRDEKTLGELFCYFILETILLGRTLDVNPFDQPSVELIKKETRKQF